MFEWIKCSFSGSDRLVFRYFCFWHRAESYILIPKRQLDSNILLPTFSNTPYAI